MGFSLEAITRPNIWNLKPYRCARDDYSAGILLDANENSFGACIDNTTHLERYPDPHQEQVKNLWAKFRNVKDSTYFFTGVGSDESIDLILRVFCIPGKDSILITPPTYGMYSVCAQVNDVNVVNSYLDESFQLCLDDIKTKISTTPNLKVIFLCSPGNPTGTLLNQSDIIQLLEYPDYNGIFVIDEAYIDFASPDKSMAKFVEKYPNLVVIQTLSKSFGLAGIRLGVSIASPEITNLFNKTKAPYNISTPTSQIAIQALSSDGIHAMKSHRERILRNRTMLIESLSPYGSILGSNDANFILLRLMGEHWDNEFSFGVYKKLADDGVVVRFRGGEKWCGGCLRISVGNDDECRVFLNKFRALMEGNVGK